MAWRIDDQVLRGEIDNRTAGRVVGRIWLAGKDEAVVLDLRGNPWRDLAGHLLRFSNPDATPGSGPPMAADQVGVVGDMTASRKARVPDCSMEELLEFYASKQPFPWHWGNVLYLEWFSAANGRVVIEAANYQLELDAEPSWSMAGEEELAQQEANAAALANFMAQPGMAAARRALELEAEDEPQSVEELRADAEDARMRLLNNRVAARLGRDELDIEKFDRIYAEERARLMRERGEKDPVLTPEEIEERRQWVDEMNAIAEEALADLEAEKWRGTELDDEPRHPLVVECSDFSVALHHEIDAAGWLSEDAHGEHPLWEIISGASCASAKLAGALDDEWPPDRLFAGDVIVRLKKARDYLRDVLRGLESAEEESLATPQWRHRTRVKAVDLLAQTEVLLREARAALEKAEDGDETGGF